jgi:hypothetical protein
LEDNGGETKSVGNSIDNAIQLDSDTNDWIKPWKFLFVEYLELLESAITVKQYWGHIDAQVLMKQLVWLPSSAQGFLRVKPSPWEVLLLELIIALVHDIS